MKIYKHIVLEARISIQDEENFVFRRRIGCIPRSVAGMHISL